MKEQFTREIALIGEESFEKLNNASVIVFGIGGVGGFTVEALVRAGVGRIDIVDKDVVDVTNINRQIIATHETVGRPKVEVMKERMFSINPEVKCEAYEMFYLPEAAGEINFGSYDYVIDCVDNVTAKLSIIEEAKKAGVKVISSMGTGNKLDPTAFKIADIAKTSVCPLAKVVRKELKARGITGVKVLYSEEEPKTAAASESGESPQGSATQTKPTPSRAPASISFVPSAAGLIIAGEVINDLGLR